jgi:hypothetical protein
MMRQLGAGPVATGFAVFLLAESREAAAAR